MIVASHGFPKGFEASVDAWFGIPTELFKQGRPGTASIELRSDVAEWIGENLKSRCGFHYAPKGLRSDPFDTLTYNMWFEDANEAILFKFRWMG